MVLHDMGKTAEGRTQWMAIVTSPENHRKLARYKEISRRLALAEGLTDDQARALAKEGKAVVWIDGGLHATETLGAQQLGEMVYQMVSRNDEETMRFLDDCIILFVHANPDGNDLVADWYMRNPNPEQRSLANLPRLYQKYIGHDNNRDFFASTQPETENINRVLYHEWFPQILYNHHQSGPAGHRRVVVAAARSVQLQPRSAARSSACRRSAPHMHQRLATEGKPGATMASGGAYDGWWNGGIRNTGNFHNIIAILTETIGSPTPMRIPLVAQRQIPNRDLPYPIAPQEWHFKQSIDYSMSFNRGVLDYASRNRENLLFNIYRMGQRSIERGSGDYWTPSPSRINAAAERWARRSRRPHAGGRRGGVGGAAQAGAPRSARVHHSVGSAATSRRPSSSSTRCARSNVTVHRATAAFQAGGKTYPAGSFVVLTNQAFRPHVIDMFEPQDHPERDPVSRRAADAALRQRRMDARVPDGRAVRSRARGVHRAVREGDRLERAMPPPVTRAGRQEHGVHATGCTNDCVHRGEPAARSRRGVKVAPTRTGASAATADAATLDVSSPLGIPADAST